LPKTPAARSGFGAGLCGAFGAITGDTLSREHRLIHFGKRRSIEQMFGLAAAIDKTLAYEGDLDPVEMCRLAERMEFLRVRALRRYERSQDWRAEGFLSAAAAVRSKCNVTHGAASSALKLGERLEQLPETAAAFAAGEITRRHAQAIAEPCTPERIDAMRDVEPQLVEVARHVNAKELRAVVRRLADSLDGDGGATTARAQYDRRRLHVSSTLDGMVMIDGVLDPLSGETVLTTLDALMEHDRARGDPRTRPQRRADALVDACHKLLSDGLEHTSRRVRPHLSAVLDLETAAPELVAPARADLAHGGHVSKVLLDTIACDCSVSRVIMAGRTEVLDVGRATRTVAPALWKALVARDRHCTAPGCDRPPGWCEVHHVKHWNDGGETNLENTRLHCRRHHWEHHLGILRE
jgi:hypothetical protein